MRARDLMTSPVLTCHVNDSLTVAAERMWDGDVGALAVVNDDGKLTGMITDRDTCMAAFTQGHPLQDLLVHTAMAMYVATASPDATIDEIEQLMAEHQVHRIPIVDAAGKPVGMVSINDLVLACDRPDARLANDAKRLLRTLAAICRHRSSVPEAGERVVPRTLAGRESADIFR